MRSILFTVRLLAILALSLTPGFVRANQSSTMLTGQVKDQSGALIMGATVVLKSATGVEKTTTTNETGKYAFTGVERGKYLLRVSARGFGPYESEELEIGAARIAIHDVVLLVTLDKEEVTVNSESGSARLSPENNAGAIVLRGKDLDILPDDPDDLAAVLQGLAGPAVGPNGGQVIVDGFTGAALPSKASIREVRINQNPFSAEFDQLGFGRIEILTRAGTDRFRGQTFFNFNDESLNARNPFAPTRAPFQSRLYGGNVSGPITAKTSSYFIDFQRRELNDNAVINATILDPAFNITPFSGTVVTPKRFITFSPRADFQLNKDHTLGVRYSYSRSLFDKAGIGDFALPSRSFDALFGVHTLQATETAVLGPSLVNEIRFQYIHTTRSQIADLSEPTVRVLESFIGGGSSVGHSLYKDHRWEFADTATKVLDRHTLRFGARLRGVHIRDLAETNFGGTYAFEGGNAPQLDANNEVVIDPITGTPVIIPISSIERYRRTLVLNQLNLSNSEIRTRGGGATQFSIAGGDPEADVNQVDLGAFVLDDWRLRPNFTLSVGLRYEVQSNIDNKINLAPRVGFAWSPPGNTRNPKTVIRGGLGVFYERFPETLTLAANRYDGNTQKLFFTTDPFILDFFPNVPPPNELEGFTLPSSIRRVAQNLREPYSMQVALSLERQLPHNTTFSVSFIKTRTLHVLRSRNINAPLPPDLLTRPDNNVGDVFLYEASGTQNLQQLIFSFFNRLSSKMTFFGSYVIGRVRNDTDGVNSFPVNSYDLSNEYGRGGFDIRQRLFAGGSINAPWGISLNPLVVMASSRPFNIITGTDANLDSVYAERPAFALDPNQPGVIVTPFGAFDPTPAPGQSLVPRNFGDGPSVFWVSLRAGKTFSFGSLPGSRNSAAAPGGPRPAARPAGPPPEKPYRLTVSFQVQNLFNHTNAGPAIGNLTSPLFGRSNSLGGGTFSDGTGATVSGGNRRIEMQLRFSF